MRSSDSSQLSDYSTGGVYRSYILGSQGGQRMERKLGRMEKEHKETKL